MRDFRTRSELYHCFLDGLINPIERAYETNKLAAHPGLTNIQLHCGISYTLAIKIKLELLKFGLITDKPLNFTTRGLEYYNKITIIMENIKLLDNFFTKSKEIPQITLQKIPGMDEIKPQKTPELSFIIEHNSKLWVGDGTEEKPYRVPAIYQLECILFAVQQTRKAIQKKEEKYEKIS